MNQDRVAVVDRGTRQNVVTSTKEFDPGIPIAGLDRMELGLRSSFTDPGGGTTKPKSRFASAQVFFSLLGAGGGREEAGTVGLAVDDCGRWLTTTGPAAQLVIAAIPAANPATSSTLRPCTVPMT